MKKITVIPLILLCISALCLPVAADEGYAPNFEVSAKAVYLYNLDTETLIYSKNADEPMYPASITKVMTCILALENTKDIDAEIVTYPIGVQNYLYVYQQQNGYVSSGGLIAGEELTMRECLYALMLPSANEVAMSIAEHIAGSQEAFAEMMNARARELGAVNTHFVNPNGLFDPEHITTARDIALIVRYASTVPGFMDIVSTPAYQAGPTNKHKELPWESTNEMIKPKSPYYNSAVKGIKTGTLPEAGRCFVSMASRDGFNYLCVVLGSDYLDAEGKPLPKNMAFVDTANLYEWVLDSFRIKPVIEKNVFMAQADLRLSLEHDKVQLVTADRFTSLLPKDITDEDVTRIITAPEGFDAPVKKGDPAGEVRLVIGGEEIGRVPLVIADSIEASQPLVLLEKAKAFTRSFWFKFGVVFAGMSIIAYTIFAIARGRRRRQSAYRPRRRM